MPHRPLACLTLIALLLLGSCQSDDDRAGAPATTTTVTATDAVDWSADLDALDAGVRRIHPNPFWRVTESDWETALAEARDELPALDRQEAELVLFRLAALLDGHSGIYPSEIGYHLYGQRLSHFTDGYFVLAGPDPSAVGGELVAIDGMPVEDAVDLVTPLIAHDNDKSIEVVVPMYLNTPEMLVGLGIIDDEAAPHFTVRRTDGTEVIVDPPLETWETYPAAFGGSPVGLPQAPEPLSQSRRNEAFWWTTIDDALYFQLNEVRATSPSGSLDDVVDAVRDRLEAGGIGTVVVDLRHNPGGDNRTYGPLLQLLQDPLVDVPGRLRVIIGRQTFSAGANFATEVDASTSAVFVGEPTGGRPNLYADVVPLELPSSGIVVQVSQHYVQKSTPDDERPWIEPDVPIELSSADYFAGRDPILDATLAP